MLGQIQGWPRIVKLLEESFEGFQNLLASKRESSMTASEKLLSTGMAWVLTSSTQTALAL